MDSRMEMDEFQLRTEMHCELDYKTVYEKYVLDTMRLSVFLDENQDKEPDRDELIGKAADVLSGLAILLKRECIHLSSVCDKCLEETS